MDLNFGDKVKIDAVEALRNRFANEGDFPLDLDDVQNILSFHNFEAIVIGNGDTHVELKPTMDRPDAHIYGGNPRSKFFWRKSDVVKL